MSNIKGCIYFANKLVALNENDKANNSITHQSGKLYLIGSGLIETFCYSFSYKASLVKTISDNASWSWMVCGIGIMDGSRFIQKAEWQQILCQDEVKLDNIDGHWVIFRWKDNIFEFYNDPFELRKLYWKKENDRIIFSTQLIDIIELSENQEFSFQNYAGFHFYKNSFGNESILSDVKRLGVNGVLRIIDDKVFHKYTHWNIEKTSEKPFCLEQLRTISNINFPSRQKPVLLLSGGMDSRTVLAMQNENPHLLTLGDSHNPDVKIAKMIAEKLKIPLQHEEYKVPTTIEEKEAIFGSFKKFVLAEFPGFMNYSKIFEDLNQKGFWVIDGGRGEVLRHGSTRNILFFGQNFIKNNDFISLSKLLTTKQYPCFEQHLEREMKKWAEIEFISAMESMQKGLNIYDWITLLQIRYRVKNCPMNSQAAHDNIIPSYMPLLQPSIIRALQSYPNKKRINNRLNSLIIKKFEPILSTVPIERFDTITPYFFKNSVVLSKTYACFYHKIKKNKDKYYDLLMLSLKEIVLDRISSNEVKNCGWYDTKKIIELTEKYYKQEFTDSKFLYNWLQIDFWREALS